MSSIQSQTQSQIVFSIYIPRIQTHFTEEKIRTVFEQMGFGNVKRVDFQPIDTSIVVNCRKRPDIHRAFVHFDDIYHSTKYTQEILYSIVTLGECFKQRISPDQFWMLLENKNPISETRLNIHQVVENARILEEQVFLQETTIDEQTLIIDNQQSSIMLLMNELDILRKRVDIIQYGVAQHIDDDDEDFGVNVDIDREMDDKNNEMMMVEPPHKQVQVSPPEPSKSLEDMKKLGFDSVYKKKKN